ncbi:MAG: nucleotidyltransferase family protein, partial [Clostridia bacterium]|nr:nucleotidyltransferase family protein [Clostridia bacterium]
MTIAGIIAEYNPFHGGHAWHVAQTRRLTGCDYVIVCMGGHFTQRGEPALWSKWARARMALACGADAVFELPALFNLRTADAFARGGVDILGGLGCDALSFGSETEDLSLLRSLAALRADEPEEISDRVREKLNAGMAHARARGEAVAEALNVPAEALNRPNTILAAEYIRAIEGGGYDMRPVAVPRIGDYHDSALGDFASASAIRAAIGRGDVEAALASIPDAARPHAAPDALHP